MGNQFSVRIKDLFPLKRFVLVFFLRHEIVEFHYEKISSIFPNNISIISNFHFWALCFKVRHDVSNCYVELFLWHVLLVNRIRRLDVVPLQLHCPETILCFYGVQMF